MSNKYDLLIVIVVLAASLSCSSARDAKDLSPEKLNKMFAKINKYLEKNVKSDDPELNMAWVVELLNVKSQSNGCFLMGGTSLIDALSMLQEFVTVPSHLSYCNTYRRRELLDLIDSGLADVSRLKRPNYSLSRIDRIVQHYAFEDARRCGYTYGMPKMNYGYKRIAYDNVNKLLVDSLPEVENVETNLAKAAELLNGMPDGALADALRQLLQLKLTLSEDSCNQRGYDILFKNDLAINSEADKGCNRRPLSRVSKIVQHFTTRHQQLCRPIVARLFKPELKRLDQTSYRLVLGLVAARFLKDPSEYSKLMEELNEKQVGEDFLTPLLVKRVTSELTKHNGKFIFHLEHVSSVAPETIYNYLVSASAGDSLSQYIHGTVVNKPRSIWEMKGMRVFDIDKLRELVAKYLNKPCARFMEVYKELVTADDYCVDTNDRQVDNYAADRLISELGYYTVRLGYFSCKYMLGQKETVIRLIQNLGNKGIPHLDLFE